MYDLEFLQDRSEKAYIKQIALNTVVEFVARTIAQSEFRFMEGDHSVKNNFYYKFNVQPNENQNAVEFWQKFIYKLIVDNEALIIKTDDDQFIVADDFVHEDELGILPQRFNSVVVNDFEYKRFFTMDKVIYMTYSNQHFEKFMLGLFEDYGEIFGRLINLQIKNNQIRGTLKFDSTKLPSEKQQDSVQSYIDMIMNAFENNTTAVAPLFQGMEYQEYSTGNSKNKAEFKELEDLRMSVLKDVARLIGVPPALIIGDVADLEKSIESYLKFCIRPLNRKISSELNRKLFTENEFLKKEKRVEIVGINKRDPLELSEAIDKLKSSGNYTGNQIRVMLGDEPVDDPSLDEYVLTKNYETVKGGENE